VRGSVRDKLAKLKMREAMDEQHLFQNVDLAVQHYLRSRDAQVAVDAPAFTATKANHRHYSEQ
jgi:hypothetical protein